MFNFRRFKCKNGRLFNLAFEITDMPVEKVMATFVIYFFFYCFSFQFWLPDSLKFRCDWSLLKRKKLLLTIQEPNK